jgi:hypothetical protein
VRLFALVFINIALLGCARSATDVKASKQPCSASTLVADPAKIRVLCFGPPHTLKPIVDSAAAEASSQACPKGYAVESAEFAENQHVHGTEIWNDSYDAIIVCNGQ